MPARAPYVCWSCSSLSSWRPSCAVGRVRQRRQLESSSAAQQRRRPRRLTAKKIKVGLVTDIGGLNDRSFNALANKGLERRQVRARRRRPRADSKSNADYVPNLSTLAQQKYDLVIGVGFLMADAMEKVAKKFPRHEVRDHRLARGGA